jgi:hypothetical protein
VANKKNGSIVGEEFSWKDSGLGFLVLQRQMKKKRIMPRTTAPATDAPIMALVLVGLSMTEKLYKLAHVQVVWGAHTRQQWRLNRKLRIHAQGLGALLLFRLRLIHAMRSPTVGLPTMGL